jgi:hypothetical protein
VDWMHVAQDSYRWQAVSIKGGEFLTEQSDY